MRVCNFKLKKEFILFILMWLCGCGFSVVLVKVSKFTVTGMYVQENR